MQLREVSYAPAGMDCKMTELPKQIELARKRAFHALGERLYTVEYRPLHGPKHWWVHVRFGDEIVPFSAPVVRVAIAEAASQLRATGWVPTHPRLEWEPESFGSWYLRMHFDAIRMDVAAIFPRKDMAVILGCVKPVPPWTNLSFHTKEKAAAHIAEWCAANLPTLHLPSFPEST